MATQPRDGIYTTAAKLKKQDPAVKVLFYLIAQFLICYKANATFFEHPDWLLRDDYGNLAGTGIMDYTNPQARAFWPAFPCSVTAMARSRACPPKTSLTACWPVGVFLRFLSLLVLVLFFAVQVQRQHSILHALEPMLLVSVHTFDPVICVVRESSFCVDLSRLIGLSAVCCFTNDFRENTSYPLFDQ